jgi:hypothetical protein
MSVTINIRSRKTQIAQQMHRDEKAMPVKAMMNFLPTEEVRL